mmetsp:Transcript_1363/g.2531  ORF Transcript_1363/g.2531 Transcript_1363/m.2531 type:complete len:244 (+) Transcript_1363:150-881(+)
MSHKIHYQAHYNKNENMPLSQSSNVDNGAITIDAGDPLSTSPTPAATVTPQSKSYAEEINNLGVCVMLSISPLGIPSFSLTSLSSGSDDDSTIDIQLLDNDSHNDEEESWSQQLSDASSCCNEQDTLSLAYSDSCIADDKSLPDVTRQDYHRPVMNLPQKLFFTSPQDWSDSDDDDDSLSHCGTSVDANDIPNDEDTPTPGNRRVRFADSNAQVQGFSNSCREMESDGEKTKLESDRTEGELC